MILTYSSSPSTALYIAAKSMTGTVRVPSMSNTTPRRRALGGAAELRVERLLAMGILGIFNFGYRRRSVLGRSRDIGFEYLGYLKGVIGFGVKGSDWISEVKLVKLLKV